MQSMVAQVGLPNIMPKTPQASTFQQYGSQNIMSNSRPNPMYGMSQQQRNKAIMAEVEMRQKQEAEYRKRVQGLLNEAVSHFSTPYSLPSYHNEKGASNYRKAFKRLEEMENKPFSVREAVFTVENAFYEQERDYGEFEKVIQETGNFIKQKMQEFGYNPKSNVAKNLILFQFFSDTLRTKNGLKHLPLKYDFQDIYGKKDWSKMFVTKLLESSTGQCHSLPLLYLMLVEEIEAVAHLSRSPNHTYIKFPDDNGMKWHNVELTSHILTTNALILQNGYIKAEAIQNKLYMHPLSKRELLAHMYTDLVMGYEKKFGSDKFTEEVTQKALQLHPTSITALLNKSNYYTEMVQHVFEQLGINKENARQKLPNHPEALELYRTMVKQYKAIDALGYKKMPDEMYQEWLRNMQQQRNNQEQKEMKKQLNKLTKPISKL